MIGSFISDDFQFYFEPEDIMTLTETRNTIIGSFACTNNKGLGLIKMDLPTSVNYGTSSSPPSSSVFIDFRKKQCILRISKQDFDDWLLAPDEYVRKVGPNWRFASTNVYIKTEECEGAEFFKRSIQNLLLQADGVE